MTRRERGLRNVFWNAGRVVEQLFVRGLHNQRQRETAFLDIKLYTTNLENESSHRLVTEYGSERVNNALQPPTKST